jgi:molybdopterin/thiamine biosynthesis adenylyltransferase
VSVIVNGSIAVVGAGGNIGSHVVPHLGRMRGVRRVVLVDRDVYEEKNLTSQDITQGDVGQPKAAVQARRLRRTNPALTVTPVADELENVPLGALRAAVLLGCLDSRVARRALNLVAWRLGVPWIDAGVRGEELLARVNVHLPGPGQPCLECAWAERDYETLEQAYPCAGEGARPASTNAPSGLGALAASLQALECQKLLDGDRERLAIGKQVTISALAHRHFVTRFAANPTCRFDHEVWRIETLAQGPAQLTVRQAFELGRESGSSCEPRRLRVPHQLFATALCCPACGERRQLRLRLLGRLDVAEQRCAACGRRMRATGSDLVEWLSEAHLPPAVQDAALLSLGFRRGDVLTVAGGTHAAHFQIGAIA